VAGRSSNPEDTDLRRSLTATNQDHRASNPQRATKHGSTFKLEEPCTTPHGQLLVGSVVLAVAGHLQGGQDPVKNKLWDELHLRPKTDRQPVSDGAFHADQTTPSGQGLRR